jgi:hypothetical protein
MGTKYIIRCIVEFIDMKSDYYRTGVAMIMCSIIPPTLFFLQVYTEVSTQKWENMKFEERNKSK